MEQIDLTLSKSDLEWLLIWAMASATVSGGDLDVQEKDLVERLAEALGDLS